MKSLLHTLLLLLVVALSRSDNWALLVAGSKQYYNYRHQADVYRAYQTLISRGFNPNRIITMAVDDIAHSSYNPFPGKIFNKPSHSLPGYNVYQGIKIDYKGDNVTPEVFLKVLEGSKQAVSSLGSGRVLELTPEDNLFIYFSDHGGPGMLCFPKEYLYAEDLLATLARMEGKYNRIVFYLESCESGSMFLKLPNNTKIYAVSAAGPNEPSYAAFCQPDDVVEGKHIGSCLGDSFSEYFIDDLARFTFSSESLEDQFEKIVEQVKNSTVHQWGDTSYVKQSVKELLGKRPRLSLRSLWNELEELHSHNRHKPYKSKLNFLKWIYQNNSTQHNRLKLQKEVNHIDSVDAEFTHLRNTLNLTGNLTHQSEDQKCLKQIVGNYEQQCGKLSDYALQYLRLMAQACEKGKAQQMKTLYTSRCSKLVEY